MSDNLYFKPWHLDNDEDESLKRGDRLSLMDRFDHEIAELTPFGDEWTVGEVRRARLLVAAPDLLEKLKIARRCIAWFRSHQKHDVQSGDGVPVELLLDETIAKAEGRI